MTKKYHGQGVCAADLAEEQAKLMVRTAINHAFLSKAEKEELLKLAESRMN